MDTIDWIDEVTAARILGVTTQTLWKYRKHPPKSGFKAPLPYYKIGRRVQFKRSEFEAWIEMHRVGDNRGNETTQGL